MAFAALTHTQKDAASSPTTTSAIDTTGATLIVVGYSLNGDFVRMSDSQNNRWFISEPVTNISTQYFTFGVCFNPTTSASHTFSLTAGNFPCLCVAAFSGAVGTLGVTTEAGASATTLLMNSITPSSNDALLLTGICSQGTDTASIDGGFTITDQGGGVSGQRGALAYLIQTTAAAAAPTWTLTATHNFCGQMLAINLAAAAGGSAGGSYGFA